MPATLKDVAERAGVSRSAVSRAFTEGASVAPGTREKIWQAAEALGYQPNALASSLTTGRTKTSCPLVRAARGSTQRGRGWDRQLCGWKVSRANPDRSRL